MPLLVHKPRLKHNGRVYAKGEVMSPEPDARLRAMLITHRYVVEVPDDSGAFSPAAVVQVDPKPRGFACDHDGCNRAFTSAHALKVHAGRAHATDEEN